MRHGDFGAAAHHREGVPIAAGAVRATCSRSPGSSIMPSALLWDLNPANRRTLPDRAHYRARASCDPRSLRSARRRPRCSPPRAPRGAAGVLASRVSTRRLELDAEGRETLVTLRPPTSELPGALADMVRATIRGSDVFLAGDPGRKARRWGHRDISFVVPPRARSPAHRGGPRWVQGEARVRRADRRLAGAAAIRVEERLFTTVNRWDPTAR